MNPEDRKALEVAREALRDLIDTGFTRGPQGKRANAALALIDERLQADEPKENPALDLSGLAYELEGVVIDTEQGGGFDDVCLRTVKRVRDTLWGVQPAIDELTSGSQADEKEEPVAWRHFNEHEGRWHYFGPDDTVKRGVELEPLYTGKGE